MRHRQLLRMQGDTVEQRMLLLPQLKPVTPFQAGEQKWFTAVKSVTYDWECDLTEVDTDLMGAAGQRLTG